MTVLDRVCKDPVLATEGQKFPRWAGSPLLDEPQGQVKVGWRQGPIEDLALIDLGELGVRCREPAVVLEELYACLQET